MNMFEGARRLAVAVAALCFAGTGVAVWTHVPYIEMHYVWNSQNELARNPLGCSGLPEYRAHVQAEDMYLTALICGSSGGQDEVTLSPPEMKFARDLAWDKKITYSKSAFGYFAVFMLTYWLVITGLGWIVRGFFGIPQGRDRKSA